MQPRPKMLMKFKSGQEVVFDLGSREDFDELVANLAGIWSIWMYIGQSAVVRKRDVSSVYYLGVTDGQSS